ncbi:HlyD family secretion protein [Aquitalea sp.]|uniref:HlyD family secretion protein n=1 Tax=Aquitalea sp. TaxID=1872623 RepID=UPI002582690A|nr:HlyD family secretion protein [Aquitalea sp.]
MSVAEHTAPSSTPPVRRNYRLAWLGLAAVAAGAVAWGGYWWQTGRYLQTTDDAYLKADSVVIAPKIGGYASEVLVTANQQVRRGDPLVRLDGRQYQAMLEQSRAQLEAREADLQRARADIAQQQAQIAQSRAQETVARLTLAHASEEVKRYAPLSVTGAASDERLAELRNNQAQAQANLDAASAVLKAATTRLVTSQAQLAQAEAQRKAAEAAQRQSHLDVDDTVLRSPQDGRVGDLSVRVGQLLQAGTRLMSIVPVQQMYLVANFKETQLQRMQVGQRASLHVDALPDVELHGVVESFSPGTGAQFALLPPENATGNFTKIVQRVPVRIRLDIPPALRARLLSGLSVTAEVDTRHEASHG